MQKHILYLKLRYRTLNDTVRIPSQPVYLRVLYQTPPEAAVNPAAHFGIDRLGEYEWPESMHRKE